MFWGISYNRWHFYLALVGMLLLSLVIFWALRLANIAEGLALLIGILSGFAIALLFHACNEAIQAIDPGLLEKYGSLESFQNDSHEDWQNFLSGCSLAAVLAIVIGIWFL